jgi:glycosyltransferase involved in cell wall biosynthesis
VAVVIPARNEAGRIGGTVRAAHRIEGVALVVVADDGSTDRTRDVASHAGAVVVSHYRSQGKAAAMVLGASTVAAVEAREGSWPPRHLLFLDADLGESAVGAAALIGPVRAGDADMTVAILPAQATAGGGHGFVVRLSRRGVARLAGFEPTQPLSGQRCLTRTAFDSARPLARGFGVETGLTIDLIRKGFRVVEVPVPLRHRVTGRDLRGQLHRGIQYVHVARALAVRWLPLA